ncbi:MAG: F0F1 ATP synthase subunit A [Candidatus Roizmanbacteria bacterium]
MPHISIKAEEVLNLFGFPITNSMILSWIVLVICILIGKYYQSQLKRKHKSSFFYLLNSLFTGIYNFLSSILHEKTKVFFPLLAAYFFYILSNNWFGLMPTVGSLLIRPFEAGRVQANELVTHPSSTKSVEPITTEGHTTADETASEHRKIPFLRANNADLNTTFALALITVSLIQFYGMKYNGVGGYLKKFFNFTSPIMFFVGILELISEVSRILSFSFRLFGNVLAGEVLISIVAFLLPSAASFFLVPFYVLELMAGAIQALVFTMISAVLINMATTKAHH